MNSAVPLPVVLLVQDADPARERYGAALHEAGFDVRTVATASDCIKTVRATSPALIVMDRVLSDGDGFELVRILKNLSSTARVPVIALTARAMRADVESAIRVGCDAFLAKPCDPDVLVLHVRRLLAKA